MIRKRSRVNHKINFITDNEVLFMQTKLAKKYAKLI